MSELIHTKTEKFTLIHDPFIAILVEQDDMLPNGLRLSQDDDFIRISKKDVDLLIQALTHMKNI